MSKWLIEYALEIVLTGITGYLFTLVKVTKKRSDATQEGVKALLRDRLISAIHKAKERGYIYIHELENINAMHKNYINLGGNGMIVHLMDEVKDLETKTNLT